MGTSTGKFGDTQTKTMGNNNNYSENIIDLTESSFTLADHNRLNNVVISLDTDESIREENNERNVRPRIRRARKRRHSTTRPTMNPETTVLDLRTPPAGKNRVKKAVRKTKKVVISEEPEEKRPKPSLGTCPICFEDFCGQPLGSTKCGHIFCLACLQMVMKVPRCPTCRTSLRGKHGYHPIFL